MTDKDKILDALLEEDSSVQFLSAEPDEAPANEISETRTVVRKLRALPEKQPERDIANDVMQELFRQPACPVWLRAAAILVAVFGLSVAGYRWMQSSAQPQTAQTIKSPKAVLAELQSPDGAWRDRQFDNDARLTAVALLALLKGEDHPMSGPYADVIRAGTTYLMAQQKNNGCYDSVKDHPAMSHALIAMALHEASRYKNEQELAEAAERARACEVLLERKEGAWAYRPAGYDIRAAHLVIEQAGRYYQTRTSKQNDVEKGAGGQIYTAAMEILARHRS